MVYFNLFLITINSEKGYLMQEYKNTYIILYKNKYKNIKKQKYLKCTRCNVVKNPLTVLQRFIRETYC